MDWTCFLLMLIWKLISCLIYIYPKSLYCIVRNMASYSAAYFVCKLLYKYDYFTSSWYLIGWVCNSISVFIHLPGWPFHLNYGSRLSITLYFWFCNYSPRSDISALQYWVEYVTLRLIWVKVIHSQLGYSAEMFQPLQLIALVVFGAVNQKPLIHTVR